MLGYGGEELGRLGNPWAQLGVGHCSGCIISVTSWSLIRQIHNLGNDHRNTGIHEQKRISASAAEAVCWLSTQDTQIARFEISGCCVRGYQNQPYVYSFGFV